MKPTKHPEATGTAVGEQDQSLTRDVAVAIVSRADPAELALLRDWAQELLAIRNSTLTPTAKAKRAIEATARWRAIWPLVKMIGVELKRIGWDERGLPARIGLSSFAAAALLFGSKAAGLAAFGGAIAVPLWVIFGAGGVFLGLLIEEIGRRESGAAARTVLRRASRGGEVIEGQAIEKPSQPGDAPRR